MNKFLRNVGFYLLIILVAITVIDHFSVDTSNKQEINYTEFVKQVDDKNVAKVVMQNSNIKGTLKDGTEFNGVNVENASYGGAICAERSAIVSAISAGYKKHDFEKMYVMCDNEKIGMSCMICRQVIQEFFEKDKMIIAMNPNGDEIVHTVEELCPYPFDEEDLK